MTHLKEHAKKIMTVLAACVMMLSAPLTALAGEPLIDMDRKGSITVTFYDESRDKYLNGGTLTMYKVADISEEDWNYVYVLTDAFKGSGLTVDAGNIESSTLRDGFTDYVKAEGLEGETKSVSSEGVVAFSGLSVGLYLFIQNTAASQYEKATPFLCSLPGYSEESGYYYDIDAFPKTEVERKATTSSGGTSHRGTSSSGGGHSSSPSGGSSTPTAQHTVEPGDGGGIIQQIADKLPQTGDAGLELIAMGIMIISGILLIIIGNNRRKENRRP